MPLIGGTPAASRESAASPGVHNFSLLPGDGGGHGEAVPLSAHRPPEPGPAFSPHRGAGGACGPGPGWRGPGGRPPMADDTQGRMPDGTAVTAASVEGTTAALGRTRPAVRSGPLGSATPPPAALGGLGARRRESGGAQF